VTRLRRKNIATAERRELKTTTELYAISLETSLFQKTCSDHGCHAPESA
tara:strand:+ start:415 stop:561 length:147 start_codon:yes stop_codon:yes gene_type:complete